MTSQVYNERINLNNDTNFNLWVQLIDFEVRHDGNPIKSAKESKNNRSP